MEQKHQEGYARKPVTPDEFSDWEDEQVCCVFWLNVATDSG
jgi:hypothetical protein